MRISEIYLKQSFSHSKWALQVIMSLTILSNCISYISKFDTALLLDYTNFLQCFFRLLHLKFNKDSKNLPKTVIFSLQVGFTSDFVPDCPFKLCFWQFKF